MLDDRYALLHMDDRRSFSLTVYDTQTLTPVSRFLHYGNGPQEVLHPRVNIVNGNVLVNSEMYVIPCPDWDGNLIKVFRPAGLTSYSEISCSPAPGIIYATTLDSDMTHLSILRFRLF